MNKIVIGSLIAFLLVGVGAIWPRPWPPTTTIIPDTPQVGSATYITNNTQGPFDGVKASFINATNIEWWYFDALSVDGTQGVAAWMFTTNPLALGQNFTEVDFILFHARFADGTGMNAFLPSTGLVVETVGEGSSGFYEEIGSGWFGAPDLSSYTFFFNDLESNITGNVYVQSTSPAHFPAALATDPDAAEGFGPLGWAVSVPAGDATAFVEVGDKVVEFSGGSGYHDHNWAPSLAGIENWYAVRGDVGDYVWSAVNVIVEGGATVSSSYINENGAVIFDSLGPDSVTVRPWGNDAQYPPPSYYPNPLGAIVQYDAGANGTFIFNVTFKTDSPRTPLGEGLGKWFGTATGGKVGGPLSTGPVMFEWLDFGS